MNIIVELHKNKMPCYIAKVEDGSYEVRMHTYKNETSQYFVNDVVLDMFRNCENINDNIRFRVLSPEEKIFDKLTDFVQYTENFS